jgi:hypothetical protein
MNDAERTSPITNAWGKVPARRIAVEHVDVFLGREGRAFNHQAQLASRAGTLFATWSSGIRDEEESGQQMVMALSRDGGRTWSEPATVAAARPGRYAPSVVVSSGLRVHDGALRARNRTRAGRSTSSCRTRRAARRTSSPARSGRN